MQKRYLFLLSAIFMLSIPASYAADDLWFYRTDHILLDIKLSTGFEIVARPSEKIDYVTANVSFFPKQTRTQSIISSAYDPQPVVGEDALIFRWDKPQIGNVPISINNRIQTTNSPVKIIKKVGFPVKRDEIPGEDMIYTREAEIIDSSSRITEISSGLASGETDMFKVVDRIAYWVNGNVAYNLSTMTKEASQKASWVMDHRMGVCDEITSLFISMLRSVGIPARFVSGIAYTNLDIYGSNWGPHGWAEVYFPEYGWVPYDVTFGEYGWIDPGHISTMFSEDAGKFGFQYSWRAERDVILKTQELKTDVNVIEIGDENKPDISIVPYMLKDNVGFGSYNLVIAEISNLADYYQSLDILLSQTAGIEDMNGNEQHIILEPIQQRRLYWVVKVDKGLSGEYMYTLPIVVYTLSNVSGKTSFVSLEQSPLYSIDEMKSAMDQMKEEETKVYSKDVRINCSLGKGEYYTYEKPEIACRLSNEGNILLRNLNVCLEDECREHNIGIGQEKEINFTLHSNDIGVNSLAVTAKNSDVSKAQFIKVVMLDEPKISVASVEVPASVNYEGSYQFKFSLSKESYSMPQDVDVVLDMAGTKKGFRLANLTGKQDFVIEFRGSDLDVGKNNFTMDLRYKDYNGKEYGERENFSVSLVDVTLWQRVMIFFKHL